MEISIAYQGGGAKVIELMAAAIACQNEDNPKTFKVIRVSGASAGAIAAAMHATHCDIAKIMANSDHLKDEVRRRFPPGRQEPWKVLLRFLRGNAIYDEDDVRALIIYMFDLGGVDAQMSISKLVRDGMQLRLVRSNIREHESSEVNERSETKLVDALVDSAAIPFVFRVPSRSKSAEILDGGLFQNLPAYAALKDLKKNQVAMGFSFPKQDAKNFHEVGLLGYGKAILSSLLDERVRNATTEIKPANIIEVPERRSTLDFSGIFGRDLQSEFRDDVKAIGVKLKAWIATAGRINGPDWHSVHPSDLAHRSVVIQEQIASFYHAEGAVNYHADWMEQEITYQSFNPEMPDIFKFTVVLDGRKNPGLQFLMFKSFDDPETGPLRNITLEVFNGDGSTRRALLIPNKEDGTRTICTLVCLDKPLTPTDVIKIVKIEEIYEGLNEYEKKPFTLQTISLSPGKSADEIKIVVHFPTARFPAHFGNTKLDNPAELAKLENRGGTQLVFQHHERRDLRVGCRSLINTTSTAGSLTNQRRFASVSLYRT